MNAIFAASDDSPLSFLSQFGVEWDILISQGLMFVILAAILYNFVFKPVIKTADARQKKIAQGVEDAKLASERLKECEKECSQRLADAASEASKIIAKTRDDAKTMLEKASVEASQKSVEAIEKARQEIVLEREKMKAELKAELTALVVKTAESVLKDELDEAAKARIAKKSAEKLG